MLGPLVDRNKNQILGTIQIYHRLQNKTTEYECSDKEEEANLGFSSDDEVVFFQLLEVISSALSSLQNQHVSNASKVDMELKVCYSNVTINSLL